MAPEQDDDAHVSYSVKELLAGIRTDLASGLSSITEQLRHKADKEDIAHLAGRVEAVEGRVSALERTKERTTGMRSLIREQVESRRWLIPTVLSAALVVIDGLHLHV
jgi:hypothetical protein